MKQLNTAQRQYLRRLAHDLKPVVQIGKNGLTPNVLDTVDRALDAHELIKIKFFDFQDQKQELTQTIVDETGGELIGLVGNIAIVYRAQSDPERRTITLP